MSLNVLTGMNMLGSGVLGTLLPFLFVLTLVVFFHELGHFVVARWAGVFDTEISSQRRLYPLCGVGSHPAAKLGRRGL